MPERDPSTFGSLAPGPRGPTPAGVTLAKATIAAAWNVQGDLARAGFAEAAQRICGIALPATPNTTATRGTSTALWLGPTSWLLVAGEALALPDFDAARDALNAAHGALFDVGASRVAWTIGGPRAAAVLAKGCPLDFHPRAFAEGACAQSVLGHVNALFHRRDAQAFTVMVARSFARDAWRSLCVSAEQYGYEVLAPAPFR